MRKRLLLDKDDIQELTFEEVMKRYENQIKTIIKIYVNYFEYEELMQIAYIGLWKAYRDYDIDRNVGFGQVVKFYVRNEITNHVRKHNRHNVPWESYNATVRYDSEELALINILPDKKNYFEEIEYRMFAEEMLESLTEQQKQIMSLKMRGYNQEKIAEIMGTNQAWVSRSLKASKKKLSAIA